MVPENNCLVGEGIHEITVALGHALCLRDMWLFPSMLCGWDGLFILGVTWSPRALPHRILECVFS